SHALLKLTPPAATCTGQAPDAPLDGSSLRCRHDELTTCTTQSTGEAFFFGATDVTGVLEVPPAADGSARVEPGSRAHVRFSLRRAVGFEVGMRFALREGGRTVGAGVVTGVRR
ncbi:MAG: hypothetical protein HY904_18520, partial [Deltaproteobacteria bacterium]|nr:hypothetical protein [Deltaproteobacteria bacterium]